MAIPQAKELLTIRITSPDKVIWEGKGQSLSSFNIDGPFDILPQHANFITIIEDKPIKIITPDGTVEQRFPHSVMYVHSNQVTVYTNF